MKVEKSVLVQHSVQDMYQLVYQIGGYPDFLPWCSDAKVLEQKGDYLTARVYIDYLMLKQHFTTRNTNVGNEEIRVTLVDGPFKYLDGYWKFSQLGSLGCQIDFILEYEFANQLFSKVLGPVFHMISSTLVDAFIKEANRRYA